MSCNIVQGNIRNMETGEEWGGEHYMLCTGFEFTTIARITHVESYMHPDDSIQICVDCLGLDSLGGVFDLSLEFGPDSMEQKKKLLKDLQIDAIFIVKGIYGIPKGDSPTLYDPQYRPVEPEFSETEAREAFRVNGKEWALNVSQN